MIYIAFTLVCFTFSFTYHRMKKRLIFTESVVEHYEIAILDYESANKKLELMAIDALNCDEVKKIQADSMTIKTKYEDLIKQYDELRRAYNQNIFKSN